MLSGRRGRAACGLPTAAASNRSAADYGPPRYRAHFASGRSLRSARTSGREMRASAARGCGPPMAAPSNRSACLCARQQLFSRFGPPAPHGIETVATGPQPSGGGSEPLGEWQPSARGRLRAADLCEVEPFGAKLRAAARSREPVRTEACGVPVSTDAGLRCGRLRPADVCDVEPCGMRRRTKPPPRAEARPLPRSYFANSKTSRFFSRLRRGFHASNPSLPRR